MKILRSLLISLVLCLVMCSACFAADKIVLSVEVYEDTMKDTYNVNDTIEVKISIDESNKKLGFVMGALEFDENVLEFKSVYKGNYTIHNNKRNYDEVIQTKYFDVGVDNNSNQILFWSEDEQNRLDSYTIGSIVFKVKKQISLDDLKFSFVNTQASDYDTVNKYEVEAKTKLDLNPKTNSSTLPASKEENKVKKNDVTEVQDEEDEEEVDNNTDEEVNEKTSTNNMSSTNSSSQTRKK